MRTKPNYQLLLLFILILAACTTSTPTPAPTPLPPTVTPIPAPTSTATLVPDPPALPIDLPDVGPITPTLPISSVTHFGFTYQQADGNRIKDGTGVIGSKNPIDIQLYDTPSWVVGVPIDGGGSIWSVVFKDGSVKSYMHLLDEITEVVVQPDKLPAGMPPLLVMHRGAPLLLTAPSDDASPLTHPVVIKDNPSNFAYIALNGDLVVVKSGEQTRFGLNALPDARILQDENGNLLVLTGATRSYSHSVLGDAVEAESIAMVNTESLDVMVEINVAPRVVEGMAPIWVDLDEDGSREIIVTLSDEIAGGQIVVFGADGTQIAEGPAIGRGFRWRHQLVVAPFVQDQAPLLVDNLTPHIGGITEFYQLDSNGNLTVVTSAGGFSTHRLGSRNLDMALAGDLDGDGTVELLIPSETGEYLGAFQYNNGRASVAWTVNIPARLATNIGAVETLDGQLAVAAGFENGILRMWLP